MRVSILFSLTLLVASFSVITFRCYYIVSGQDYFWFIILLHLFILAMLLLIYHARVLVLFTGWDGLGVASFLLVASFFSWRAQMVPWSQWWQIDLEMYASSYFITTATKGIDWCLLQIYSICIVGMWYDKECSSAIQQMVTTCNECSNTSFSIGTQVNISHCRYLFVHPIFRSCSLLFIPVAISRFDHHIHWRHACIGGERSEEDCCAQHSQLGFMRMALGLSLLLLCSLHLFTHALFKSCIFIVVGGFIGSTFSLQDCRGYSNVGANSLTSLCILGIRIFSLRGLLFSSGFVSKDLIITAMMNLQSASAMLILIRFGLLLTLNYSARMLHAIAIVRSSTACISNSNKIMMVSTLPVALGGVIGGLLLVQRSIFIPLSFSFLVQGLPVFCLGLAVFAMSTKLKIISTRWMWCDYFFAHAFQRSRILSEFRIIETGVEDLSAAPMKAAWIHGVGLVLLIFSIALLTICF